MKYSRRARGSSKSLEDIPPVVGVIPKGMMRCLLKPAKLRKNDKCDCVTLRQREYIVSEVTYNLVVLL